MARSSVSRCSAYLTITRALFEDKLMLTFRTIIEVLFCSIRYVLMHISTKYGFTDELFQEFTSLFLEEARDISHR